jgi:hypothetical protein
MKRKTLLALAILLAFISKGQVAINTNSAAPAASAMLDVSSSSKGMLMPRMTSAQRKAVQNPEKGLLVFDTDLETIYFFNGAKWKPMMTATESTVPMPSRTVEGASASSGFGASVDIYDNFVVVGAPDDTAKGVAGGAAYVFSKSDGNWKQVAKLSSPAPGANDDFGQAVSISGDLIVVGAPKRNTSGVTEKGAAYVFKRTGHVWNYVASLTVSNGAAYDHFGTAVTTNGTYAIIGAPDADNNGKLNAGLAYVFGLQNGAWTQKIMLQASDPSAEAKYGYSIDIWQTRLVVGAPAAPVPHNGNTNGGAAYIYNNTDAAGFTWILANKITPVGYTHNDMEFGYAVAIEGDNIVVGAPNYSGIGGGYSTSLGLGCAVRFKYQNGTWSFVNIIPEYVEFHRAGTSVALSGGIPLYGMPKTGDGRGKVVVGFNPTRDVYSEDPNEKFNFGGAIAAHNGQFVVTCTKKEYFNNRVYFGLVEP